MTISYSGPMFTLTQGYFLHQKSPTDSILAPLFTGNFCIYFYFLYKSIYISSLSQSSLYVITFF